MSEIVTFCRGLWTREKGETRKCFVFQYVVNFLRLGMSIAQSVGVNQRLKD